MFLHHISKFIFLLVWVALLAACSNSTSGTHTNANDGYSSSSESAVAPNASDQPSTKLIETMRGKIEIPVKPERIVTDGYLPELLVLGLKPVGSTRWDLENKVIQDRIDGIASTGERSLETIVELAPDLIVTWAGDVSIIQQYEKIAPTLAIPYGSYSDIHETIRYLGGVLDKEAEAEQWLAEFDQTVEEARAELAKVIKPEDTFALMGVFVVDKGFYVYGDGGYRGGEALYRHLQLRPPAKQQEEMIGKEAYRQISYEVLDEYAGDYIFIDQGDLISDIWGDNQGLWNSLDAVKNNRVFKLDPDLFWGNDPVSLELQIQEVVKMLTGR